jgi:hypothetical protein
MTPNRSTCSSSFSATAASKAQEYAIRRFTDLAVVYRGVVDVLQDILPVIEDIPELTELIANGMRMTEYLAGSDDELDRSLARFAVNGLLGECRRPGERTDDELRTLCDVAIRRLLRLP